MCFERGLKPAALVGLVLPEFFGNPVDQADLPANHHDYLPQRVFFESIPFSPNPVEHLLAREYTARRFEEMLQNLEFLWSQIDGMAVDQDFMTSKVHQ